jgi:hypothetical protein
MRIGKCKHGNDLASCYECKKIMEKVPRTFMTPAYVREIEPGLYEMWRDVEVEENGRREKHGRSIGPIMILRPARRGERVDFITSTSTGEVIELHRISGPKPEFDFDGSQR